MNRRALIGAALVAGFAPGLPARAADTSPGVAIGALASQPAGAVVVRSTHVSLKGDAARIATEVAVQGGAPARLVLRTPLFAWQGDAAMYPDRQFPELAVTVDSAPVALASVPRAFMGRAEVTDLLRQAGLDPFAIAAAPPVVAPGDDTSAFDRLAALGAVTKLGDVYLARWSARREASWPAGAPGDHAIVLSYAARPAFGLTTIAMLDRIAPLSAFCETPAGIAAALGAKGSTQVVARSYTIPVGADSRAGRLAAGRLAAGKLSADVEAPFAAFCGAHGKPAAGRNPAGPAEADATGVVRVLALGPPGS